MILFLVFFTMQFCSQFSQTYFIIWGFPKIGLPGTSSIKGYPHDYGAHGGHRLPRASGPGSKGARGRTTTWAVINHDSPTESMGRWLGRKWEDDRRPKMGKHAASSDHGTYFYNLLQIWCVYNIYIYIYIID